MAEASNAGDVESQMANAISAFREKMRTSNRKFIADRVAFCRRWPFDEAGKLDQMARYWDIDSTGYPWPAWPANLPPPSPNAPAYLIEEREHILAVRSLDDVLALPHHYMDGTDTPVSGESRELFLRVFEEEVNAHANEDLFEEHIPLPADLPSFLKYTTSVHDPDFRKSGTPPFEFWAARGGSEADMKQRLRGTVDPGYIVTTAWVLEDEWEVAAGFQGGEMTKKPDRTGMQTRYTFYLYCRRSVEDDEGDGQGEQDDWAWRVFYCCNEEQDEPVLVFEGIIEFLAWYGGWFDRLDMKQVQRDAEPAPPQERQAEYS